MTKSAVNSNDIRVDNARYRDFILAIGAKFLAGSKTVLWYVETLVLSARFLQMLRSVEWGVQSKLFLNRYRLWESTLKPRIKPGAVVYEFGVASGAATAWWARQDVKISEWHGFDTFTGLPTPWKRAGVDVMEAGVFDQSKSELGLPNVVAGYPIVWHKGLISKTLTGGSLHFSKSTQNVLFIDVDLYQPTREVLSFFSKALQPGDLIYFDEGFDPWNEGLALQECINELPPFRALSHTGSALLIVIN
jgi:hypothetical protein